MEPIFKFFLNECGVLSCALLDMSVTGRSWKKLRNVVIIKKELQTQIWKCMVNAKYVSVFFFLFLVS
jgi:hypothetical protein